MAELSKNQLKKLAKKAERDAKKGGGKAADASAATAAAAAKASAANANAKKDTKASSSSVPAAPAKTVYYLANASTDGCSASLKASIASSAFGVDLVVAPAGQNLPSFFSSPALYTSTNKSVVAFGGNGVAKALSLIGSTTTSDNVDSAILDEWLELERTSMRKNASAKAKAAALAKVEQALEAGCGSYLVNGVLSVADISIIVTLGEGNYSDAVQSYINLHTTSSIFTSGTQGLKRLVPPPPFDIKNDPSTLGAVNSVFHTAVCKLVPHLASHIGTVVEKCKVLKKGDYQCKEAMPLFSKLKSSGTIPAGINSPQQIAQAIIDNIPGDNPVIEELTMNGPGFILCRIKASYLEHHVNVFMNSSSDGKDPKLPLPKIVTDSEETVVVDFSSPNIAKEMHVGHLRSTIIGESVCRILEFTGANVKRVNHVGDWGTQFGMLITFLKEAYPEFGHGGADVDIGGLTAFYKRAKERFDEDADFKKTSQLNVVKLQAGDEECRAIWQTLCDISRLEFEKVYKRLDITVEECGESFYNKLIPPVIEEFEKAGHIKKEEGGAKCVFVPGYKIPLMLQKSDGGFGYDSTDMAALHYRLHDLGATRAVYITDFSQGDHFKMCYLAAEKIGWVDKKKHRLEHIGFGTVMGEDGKRFKTRSGETVRLVDLLDEAVSRMGTSLYERIEEKKAVITKEQVPEVSAAMGYGAVKYFDLRRNPTSNYKFSYDDMLDTKGNTAIYLLYAHARLESIISKGLDDHKINVDDIVKNNSAKIVLGHPSERNLALHLQMFADMIVEVLDDLYPYRVCDFLYALSQAVSEFITKCKVIGSDEMESRLLLCRASAIVMRQCFQLLAIQHVDRI